MDELRRVYTNERDLIDKVLKQIPRETRTKVRSILLPIADDPAQRASAEDALERPAEVLADRYGVTRIDDEWFIRAQDSTSTQELKDRLVRRAEQKWLRPKLETAAIHDAVLLLWIAHERADAADSVWLVTRDSSLYGIDSSGTTGNSSYCVGLDAFIQWTYPVVGRGSADDGALAADFAQLIRSRLLPQSKIFTLEDFRMFERMAMDCSFLPPEDVEECILTVKKQVGQLDPGDADGRERMFYVVQQFFQSPGREFEKKLRNLTEANVNQRDTISQLAGNAADQKAEDTKRLRALEQENDDLREGKSTAELRASAINRLHICGWTTLMAECVAFYLSVSLGDGDNWWQRLISSAGALVIPLVVGTTVCYFWLGDDRRQALGPRMASMLSAFRR